MVHQVPNLISVLRLLLVPAFAMLLLEGQFGFALLLFVLMGISDALDGFLARVMGASSTLGAALDPLADKVMLVAAFVMLGHLELLPLWFVMLVVGRDVLVTGGSLFRYLFHPDREMPVLSIGKINTFVQIVFVFFLIGSELLPLLPMARDVLLWGTVLTTVASGGAYLLTWAGWTRRAETEPK